MVNVVLEIVSCFCNDNGLVFDFVTIVCFFLAGCFCVFQAPWLDAPLPNELASRTTRSAPPTAQAATAFPVRLEAHSGPPVAQTVVTTTTNADGSITKTTQVTVRNPDGSQTLTETVQTMASPGATAIAAPARNTTIPTVATLPEATVIIEP